jgi:hypothetical protein
MSIKLAEARKLLIEEVTPFFEKHNFKMSTSKRIIEGVFNAYRDNGDTIDQFGAGFYKYVGSYGAIYGYSKSHKKVNEIMLEIAKNIKLSDPVRKDSDNFYLGMAIDFEPKIERQKINEVLGTEEPIYDRETAAKVAKKLIKRSEEVIFPLLTKFEDLREIDKVINNLDDLWYDDWMKPFGLGGNFYVKRFIIAKLSGNPRYEELADRVFDMIDKKMEEQGRDERADRVSLNKPIPYTVHFLKDIKPLYDSYE